jgi:signal transduction histidine kinase
MKRTSCFPVFMSSFLKTKSNPFRFLLYTEWVMLASCGSLAFLEAIQNQSLPIQHILILVCLGLMGWQLPDNNLFTKILYTLIELSLIFYGTILGYLHILPTLYLIVVIRSCFLFDLIWRWAIAFLVFLLFLGEQFQKANLHLFSSELSAQKIDLSMDLVAETLVFGLSIFFVVQLVNKLLTERQIRNQLTLANKNLQEYADKIEELVAVQERNRIARDIHDSLGHALTSLNIQLQTALKLWPKNPTKAQPFLLQAQQLGAIAIKEVRQSVSTLRADAEEVQNLEAKLEFLINDLRQNRKISVSSYICACNFLSPLISTTLYRLIQEALTNISKHAQATKVKIQMMIIADLLLLTITDNGKGFNLNTVTHGFGLQGMKERLASIDGYFEVKTKPGEGCQIVVRIPIEFNFN